MPIYRYLHTHLSSWHWYCEMVARGVGIVCKANRRASSSLLLIAKKGKLPCFEELRCMCRPCALNNINITYMWYPEIDRRVWGVGIVSKANKRAGSSLLMPLRLPFPIPALPVFTLPSFISSNNILHLTFTGTFRISCCWLWFKLSLHNQIDEMKLMRKYNTN